MKNSKSKKPTKPTTAAKAAPKKVVVSAAPGRIAWKSKTLTKVGGVVVERAYVPAGKKDQRGRAIGFILEVWSLGGEVRARVQPARDERKFGPAAETKQYRTVEEAKAAVSALIASAQNIATVLAPPAPSPAPALSIVPQAAAAKAPKGKLQMIDLLPGETELAGELRTAARKLAKLVGTSRLDQMILAGQLDLFSGE